MHQLPPRRETFFDAVRHNWTALRAVFHVEPEHLHEYQWTYFVRPLFPPVAIAVVLGFAFFLFLLFSSQPADHESFNQRSRNLYEKR